MCYYCLCVALFPIQNSKFLEGMAKPSWQESTCLSPSPQSCSSEEGSLVLSHYSRDCHAESYGRVTLLLSLSAPPTPFQERAHPGPLAHSFWNPPVHRKRGFCFAPFCSGLPEAEYVPMWGGGWGGGGGSGTQHSQCLAGQFYLILGFSNKSKPTCPHCPPTVINTDFHFHLLTPEFISQLFLNSGIREGYDSPLKCHTPQRVGRWQECVDRKNEFMT